MSAAGIKTLTFQDEVAAGNRTARMLKAKGVNAMVALVHQGGTSPSPAWTYTCGNGSTITGDIVPIAVISLLLAFVATLYPSWRASRVQPAQALRYE